jgi:hypothetical protein
MADDPISEGKSIADAYRGGSPDNAKSSDSPVSEGRSIADAYRTQSATAPPPDDPTQGDTIAPGVRAILAPAPNTTYGDVLPLARDQTTGQLRFAMPNAFRSTLQGGLDLLEGPITGTVTPAATMALASLAAAGKLTPSPASGSGAAVAGAAAQQALDRAAPLSPEFKASPLSPEFEPPDHPSGVAAVGPTSAVPNAPHPLALGLDGKPAIAAAEGLRGGAPKTAAEAKAIASTFYRQLDQQGANLLPPQTASKFVDMVQREVPASKFGAAVGGDTEATAMLGRIESMRDEPMTFKAAQEIDESMSNLITKQYGLKGLSKDGEALLRIQEGFRDMIADAPGSAGDAFDALGKGRAAWSQARKMDDLERIQARAEQTDNPASSYKTQIRTLLNNRSRSRGYTDAERTAVEDAGKRGMLGSALHVFGTRLLPLEAGGLGFLGGGPIGALAAAGAAHFGTTALRAGATALQRRRLQNALDVLGRGVPLPPAPLPGNLLTPGARIAASRSGLPPP